MEKLNVSIQKKENIKYNMSDYPHNWPQNSVPIKWITLGCMFITNGKEKSFQPSFKSN